ncbi:MAG: methylenetetrahydrofolate--tRNA-(uracil(54)-C(5))-methyltransferase (FADH(2)-oxidizing) TrmFO [Candidatus Puniceispirillaceae bacterium]|jgi:methylenetetrahydrofolate--tRNA-(uracil-5-)-methyltransferase|nr:methylenetetrahydrofolate--tRNA-(uracil(54)-C(5))-methyltransferase (FADH(2)-oxidizing) TrmFO [Alphaproteobacteria bacterium]MDA8882270.1 methylenetetrahydrofolate--tRNA-(uracil(54)-C(5))-methyltransferase (FADH(2)-oxidizing) TrmFO [Alphaproteobacteria bacterium]
MTDKISPPLLHIIGGGLAGSEAAWQAAEMGVSVALHEMRPVRKTDVHETENLAELVCSNSFRSDDASANAVGVLHAEMRMLNSVIMAEADKARVPAGGALAVDRDLFSQGVQRAITAHPNITLIREEVAGLPPEEWGQTIIATGPLTSPSLAEGIRGLTGEDDLAFFDAIAPILHVDSINMDVAWFQSRYDKTHDGGDGKDYINCPMTEEQYHSFISEMLAGDKMSFREWEENTPYFDGCMPVEVMAERGEQTLRFGPMKPVGLTNSHDGSRPYAVVQLRQDNKLGTLFNMVGFQTKLKYAEQVRIFQMIPGLEGAQFARLGGLHRNTFINSPRLLDEQLRLKARPALRFAGQITGVEGYIESAAIGGMTGQMAASDLLGLDWQAPPIDTAHGALLSHLTGGAMADSFQPMNVNFGLFPPLEMVTVEGKKPRKLRGRDRKAAYAGRALSSLAKWANVTLPEELAHIG